MQLQVKYKDSSSRIVNLTEEFFSSKNIDKTGDPGVARKATDMAYLFGSEPYYIGVFKGSLTVYETHIRRNQPDDNVVNVKYKVDEFDVKKRLRKEYKKTMKKNLFTKQILEQFVENGYAISSDTRGLKLIGTR